MMMLETSPTPPSDYGSMPNGSVGYSRGTVITGTRISLSIHFDKEDAIKQKIQPPLQQRTPTPVSSRHGSVTPDDPGSMSSSSESDLVIDHQEVAVRHRSKKMEIEAEVEMVTPTMVEVVDGPDQIINTTNVCTWRPDGATILKIGERGISAIPPISVPTLLERTASRYPDTAALKVKRDGKWQTTTYREYVHQVRTAAKGFIRLGLERFHGVCIMGFNSPEWLISDLAAIYAGGFATGIYTTNSPEVCLHCASNCEANIYIVEDEKYLNKVLKFKDKLPSLKAIIQYSGKPEVEGVLSWSELMHLGESTDDGMLEDRIKRLAVNQCCTLIYTSGTTGMPKGVMLSHDNLTWLAQVSMETFHFNYGSETYLSYLPLSHAAAQIADIYIPITSGGTLYFCQPDALKGSLGDTLKEVQPTKFLGVPRVWEKIHEKMMDVAKDVKGLKKVIATWAKARGWEYAVNRMKGSSRKPFGYSLANALVLKKVQKALGLNRVDVVITGAAPISPELLKYFWSLGIPLYECFGMSECAGPHTINTDKALNIGTVGKNLLGVCTKLDNTDTDGQGEMCLNGRNVFMGYLRQEDKTRETVDCDGWLRTGDLGKFDNDGFLSITGRIKEILITAGGENVAPVLIEDNIKEELPCISNAMVVGDKRKFLSVLLTFKTQVELESADVNDTLAPAAVDWCRKLGNNSTTVEEILSNPDNKLMSAIQIGIDKANSRAISNAQRIQKWTILPYDFTLFGGELGPTLKMKRFIIAKKYAEIIDTMYVNT